MALVPEPETFAVTTPAVSSDGTPAPGAGELETAMSRDVYTFTGPEDGGRVWLDWRSRPGNQSRTQIRLIDDATGKVAASNISATDWVTSTLSAGDYRLEVAPHSADDRYTGSYEFILGWEPRAGPLEVTLPADISQNVPAPGAGNLENIASVDSYAFTIPAGEARLWLDWISGPAGKGLAATKIVDTATGSTVASSDYDNDWTKALPAGTYRLELRPRDGRSEYTGAYRLRLAWWHRLTGDPPEPGSGRAGPDRGASGRVTGGRPSSRPEGRSLS